MIVGLQLCRPLPGAVTLVHRGDNVGALLLQLCRPLPGAVTSHWRVWASGGTGSFNCAAPFRGRLLGGIHSGADAYRRFNCAAPFRGRLPRRPRPAVSSGRCFNCAAPFRGRLPSKRWGGVARHNGLQLCRPLPGAVTCPFPCVIAAPDEASIVPPPSGGGYPLYRDIPRYPQIALQLCRPLPGAVTTKVAAFLTAAPVLQLCRPLPGAVTGRAVEQGVNQVKLQLCRPLPGAVTRGQRRRRSSRRCFNCAAPFRGRLRWARDTAWVWPA